MDVMTNSLINIAEAKRFNRWMYSQYEPFIRWGSVLEIGSGIGNMSDFLLEADRLYLSEYEDRYRQVLQDKYAGRSNVEIHGIDLDNVETERYRNHRFDTIISTNVLEHIENDQGAVQAISDIMHADTHMITVVPAHPFLYGEIDRLAHHYRRYTRKSLLKLLENCGQEVIHFQYFNKLSAIPWYVKTCVFKNANISKRDIRLVERLVPIFHYERYLPLPFGQSIITVSKKRRAAVESTAVAATA